MEYVTLLGEDGAAIGSLPKSEVHTRDTPLHLAFSCHLVDDRGRILLTRRALSKQTWPGVWTNSFCGHPQPGEDMVEAVRRRAVQELGAPVGHVQSALPDYRYRAVDASGIVENEVCPVFVARLAGPLSPSSDEVAEWAWVDAGDAASAVIAAPFAFSPWLAEQLPRLRANGTV